MKNYAKKVLSWLLVLSLMLMPGIDQAFAGENENEITGFAEFDFSRHYLQIDYNQRPEESAVTAMMPSEVSVYLNGSSEAVSLPVTWEMREGSLADTPYYYVEYVPVYEKGIKIDRSNEELAMSEPAVGVFLNKSANSNEMNGITSSSHSGAVSTYAYSSSPYEEKIFSYLHNVIGYNSAVCCGIMANLYCESGFWPNNLQDSGNRRLGMSDSRYTYCVDNYIYNNFVYDSIGYGLCQWTYYSRKSGLLSYARRLGVSISNYKMQLSYMVREVNNGYSTLRSKMRYTSNTADGAYNLGFYWCRLYEAPASSSAAYTRGSLAYRAFWPRYKSSSGIKLDDDDDPVNSVAITQSECSKGDLYKATTDVNIRTGAGTSFSKICVAKANSEFIIEKVSGDWGTFNYKGSEAYVHMDYVRLVKSGVDTHTYGDAVKLEGENCVVTITKTCEKCSYNCIQVQESHKYTENRCEDCGQLKPIKAPESVTAENNFYYIMLEWSEVADANGYDVYRSTEDGEEELIGSAQELLFKDRTCESGVEYTYQVVAKNVAENTIYSDRNQNNITIMRLESIAAEDISLKNTQEGVCVTYPEVAGAVGYDIYRKSGDDYDRIAVCVEGTSYTDTEAPNGKTCYYKVKAVNGEHRASAPDGPSIMALSCPDITIENQNKSLKISWKASSNVDGYKIYRKNSEGKYILKKTVSNSVSSYTQDKVYNYNEYTFKVISFKGDERSAGKAKSRIYVPAVTVKASNKTDGIALSWNSVSRAEGYIIYRKKGSGDYVKIAERSASSTSYKDTNVSNNTVYRYKVKAVYAGSKSYGAIEKCIRFKPVKVSLKNGTDGIRVSWTKSSHADYYKVYRRTSNKSFSLYKTVYGSNSFTDYNTANGTMYYYRVVAYGGEDKSSYTGSYKYYRLSCGQMTSLSANGKYSLKVSVARNTAASGYLVRYSRYSNLSNNKTAIMKGYSNTSRIIKGLKFHTLYYADTRTYKDIDDKRYYSAWSRTWSAMTMGNEE